MCQPRCNDDFNHSDWWEDQWSTTLNRSVTKLEPDHKQCVGGQRFHLNTHLRKRWSVPQSHQAICRNGYGGGITSVMFLSCCYYRLFRSLVEGEKWCHLARFFFPLVYRWWKLFLPSKVQSISIFHTRRWGCQWTWRPVEPWPPSRTLVADTPETCSTGTSLAARTPGQEELCVGFLCH